MEKCHPEKVEHGEKIDWAECEKLAEEKAKLDNVQVELQNQYEGYVQDQDMPILRLFKIKSLKSIIEEAVNRKYKISFFKGMQLFIENTVLYVLMISVILKSNIFALIYLLFVIKYLQSPAKQNLLVKLTMYISFCLSA